MKSSRGRPARTPLEFWLQDGYICPMPSYSVAEAKDSLSSLIDRALAGEEVIVTRHGKPVVQINAVPPAPRPITQADLEWLRRAREKVGSRMPAEDAGTLVSRMRDEDWAR